MILGLDVGGTQTDAVLIEGAEIVAASKTPTRDNLLETLRQALNQTLSEAETKAIQRTAFSTTLATNAIVQDRLEKTGMIVSAGPGIDPRGFTVGPAYHVVEGCLDHQGFEAVSLNRREVLEAAARIHGEGITVAGVVGKFSVRNPAHERQMADWTSDRFSHVAMGHTVSGVLNFPRRIATTYLNAALHGLHGKFSDALGCILDEKNITAPRYLLKPDGGTIDLESSGKFPAQNAQSGPAASVMGALALDGCGGPTLVLDVGGTTTDMSLVLDGLPLFHPHGIKLGPYKTLIRSIITHSLGVGGDSAVRRRADGTLKIGPFREGPPAAFGGPAPTPTDAMITLGLLNVGDKTAARKAILDLGQSMGLDPTTAVRAVLRLMADTIAESAQSFIHEINAQPVYTIHEVLKAEKLMPVSVLIIGGPAPQMAPYIGEALGLPARVPRHHEVANAVGAAVARVTAQVTLQADTERGTAIIPEANMEWKTTRGFDLDEAVVLARETLFSRARLIGAQQDAFETTISEKQVFNMIRNFRRVGQNIRLKMSITPGLAPQWKRKYIP